MNTKEAKKMIKKLRVSSGTMILLKFNDPKSEVARATVNNLAQAVDESTIRDVFIFAVQDLDSVKTFGLPEMNRMGWYRKSQITDLLRVISESGNKKEEDKDGE